MCEIEDLTDALGAVQECCALLGMECVCVRRETYVRSQSASSIACSVLIEIVEWKNCC